MSIKKYIKNKKNHRYTVSGIEVIQAGDFLGDFSLKDSIAIALAEIPDHLLRNIDSIYVGDFKHLKSRKFNAAFKDGAMFVSNEQDNEEDLINDIVHELAHSVEEIFGELIYSDGGIEQEFLNKRRELWSILNTEGHTIGLQDFQDTEYNENFDQYLYQVVGYPTLSMLTVNLFYSPYGATSLREYFANAFEGFFHYKDVERIKNISPKVFDKLTELLYIKEEE